MIVSVSLHKIVRLYVIALLHISVFTVFSHADVVFATHWAKILHTTHIPLSHVYVMNDLSNFHLSIDLPTACKGSQSK